MKLYEQLDELIDWWEINIPKRKLKYKKLFLIKEDIRQLTRELEHNLKGKFLTYHPTGLVEDYRGYKIIRIKK